MEVQPRGDGAAAAEVEAEDADEAEEDCRVGPFTFPPISLDTCFSLDLILSPMQHRVSVSLS